MKKIEIGPKALAKMLDDEGGHEFMIGPPAPIDITEGERLARAFAADLAAGWDLEPDDYLAHHGPEYILELYGLVRDLVAMIPIPCAENAGCKKCDRARALLGRVKLE